MASTESLRSPHSLALAGMKLETWAKECKSDLEKAGFYPVKNHVFYRVSDEVFQNVSFQGQKNDIYIWFNAIPLALPNFWPNTGWGPASGRFPEQEGELFVNDAIDVGSVSLKLKELNKDVVIPHLKPLQTLELLEAEFDNVALPATGYPKAVCNFLMAQYDRGRQILEQYISWCRLFSNDEAAETLLRQTDEEIMISLAKHREKNVKKYHLTKLLN